MHHQCTKDDQIQKLVTLDMRDDNGKLHIIENVPALVCNVCEEKSFSGEVVDAVMEMIYSDVQPIRFEAVPVHDLQSFQGEHDLEKHQTQT
jgi:YgiT-type zinc finger domain-containing protein